MSYLHKHQKSPRVRRPAQRLLTRRKRIHRFSAKRQQGVAIVLALFIVALVVVMAYAMMSRLSRDTRRTELILRTAQADLYAQGSVIWAIDTLRTNAENKKPNQLIDVVPIQSPANKENIYKIQSTIYDMQGRFNLNKLDNADAQARFAHLLHLLQPKITEQQGQEIGRAVADWVVPGKAQNTYAEYYANLPIPYRAAHKPMVSPSELRLVKGVSPEIYQALLPYITALPASALLNVQTADAPVLAALAPSMTLDTGRIIEQQRRQKPFVSLEAFTNMDVIKNNQIKADSVTVTSNYFLVETTVTVEKQRIVLYTLLERSTNGGKPSVTIIWQSKGTW